MTREQMIEQIVLEINELDGFELELLWKLWNNITTGEEL